MFFYNNFKSRIVSNGRDGSCRDHSNSNDAPSEIFRKHDKKVFYCNGEKYDKKARIKRKDGYKW